MGSHNRDRSRFVRARLYKAAKRLAEAPSRPEIPAGRVPRISRLMARAIKMDRLVQEGRVRDFAELSRLSHVSRARVAQIMNLNFLALDIQEEILFLTRTERWRDPGARGSRT